MELKSNAHSNTRQTAKETPGPSTLMLLLIVQTFSGSEYTVFSVYINTRHIPPMSMMWSAWYI